MHNQAKNSLDEHFFMNNYAVSMHNYESTQKKVAVVGGSGYSGLELNRLLKKHPGVSALTTFTSQTVGTLEPSLFDVVFLATPAEVSAELAPKILAANTDVIDLSGAFRLNEENASESYQTWYKFNHPSIDLVPNAQFGLVPWFQVTKKSEAVLISNPGCYATAILMGLLPLLRTSQIKAETLVIDAKSGTTGAGKKAAVSQLFSEVEGECLPYKVGNHQHLPEIKLYAQVFGDQVIDPFFSTSLLATRRGIIAGIYAKLEKGKNALSVWEAFHEFYASYPLVECAEGCNPELMSLKKVTGTAKTHITFQVIGDKLYLFSSIDNLLKGAASQAMENFNHLYHFPVTAGLEQLEAIV